MEKQIELILQTINETLHSLPPYASDVWEIMVKGTAINGWVNVGLFVTLVVSLCITVSLSFYFKDDYELEPLQAISTLASLILAIVTLYMATSFSREAIVSILNPEYQLIREAIYMIGGN